MATLTSQLIVRLIDGVTGPANAAARSLRGLNSAAAGGGVVGQYQRSLAGMAGAAVSLRENTAKAAAFGAPMTAGLGYAAKLAFDFEKAGNFLEALGDASASQRAEFEKFANTLNEKYPQSLGEIIRTGNELLKAGLSYSQMMGAIDQTLATAILGDMKPSEVATMISAALNAFQLPKETTEQAIKSTGLVTDRMTYAAVKSTASLRDMGEMFKYVAAAAAATGNSIDDVTAMALAFSANKINGSEAGVALRSAIVRLAKGGTKKGNAALARVGMDIPRYQRGRQTITTDRIVNSLLAGGVDVDGKSVGAIDANPIRKQIDALVKDPELVNAPTKLAAKVTALVQEHMTKSGSAMDAKVIAESVQESIIAAGSKIDLMRFFTDLREKMAQGLLTDGDLANILEGRHFARYQALMQKDLNKLKKDIEENSAGYTQSRYQIVIKGIVGAFYELTAALEGLSVAFGRAVFPEVAAGLKRISAAAKDMATSNPAVLKLIAAFAGFLIVLGPLGLLMSGAVASIGMFVAALSLLWNAALAASAGLLLLAGAPIIASLAGLRAALLALFLTMKAGGIGAALAMVGSYLLATIGGIGAALLALLNPMRLVTAAAFLMRGALMLTGVGLVIGGIAAAGTFLYNNFQHLGLAARWFGRAFMDALGPAKPAIQGVVDGVSTLFGWLGKMLGPLSPQTWAEWGAAAGNAVGSVVAFIAGLPGKIASALGAVSGWAQQLGSTIIGGFGDVGAAVVDAASSLGSRAAEALSGAFSALRLAVPGGDGLASIFDAMKSSWSSIQAWWSGLTLDGTSIASSLQSTWAGIQSWWSGLTLDNSKFEGWGFALGQSLRSALDGTLSTLQEWWSSLSQWWAGLDLAKNSNGVLDFFANLGKQIVQTLSEINLYDLGASIMSKLLDGLTSWAGRVKSFFSGLFSGISAPSIQMPSVQGAAPAAPAAPAQVPARAAGGPISAGQAYLVGERGPELITASRSGYVHPTGSFGIGGQAAGAGGITVSPVFNMTFNGKTDSEDVVDQIRRVLRDEVRETFRGVFSDTSMRFA